MILKILEKGSTKVYAPDDQVADYLFLGFTDTGTTTEVVVTDPSKEIVEMKIEDDIATAFRYKGDPVWRTVAGGGGGTDTYKVKVDGTDTADYLENKLQQGTNVTITKVDGKLVVSADGGSGGGVTVYADLATIKAVDTTAYTDVQTVQVTNLGLYKFQPASTLTGDDVNVITPDVGVGKWILQSIAVEEIASSTIGDFDTVRKRAKFDGRFVKTERVDTSKVRIVGFGSSVMNGQELTNPSSEGYFSLQLAELGANYEGFKNCIGGNTTQVAYGRFFKDVVPFEPDIVWIGFSPNNNGLAEQNSQSGVDGAINAFETYLDKIVQECVMRGYEYVVTGVYPKNSMTAIAYKGLKELNFRLCQKYGTRYINILGILDDGTGKIKSGYYTADGTHLTATAHARIHTSIPIEYFKHISRVNVGIKFNEKNGVNIGSDVTSIKPIRTNDLVTNRIRSFTVNESFKNIPPINSVLLYIYAVNVLTLIINASGNIELQQNGTTWLDSGIKPRATGFNRIGIIYDQKEQKCKIIVNGVTSAFTATIADCQISQVVVGGGGTAANNAVNTEFKNLCKWTTILSPQEIIADYNGVLIESCLDGFYPLDTAESSYRNLGINPNQYLSTTTTTLTLANETDNNYTDTEKTKLANSTSGTFTTNDGKTITVVGGMITNIA